MWALPAAVLCLGAGLRAPPGFSMESMPVTRCTFNGSQTFGKDKCEFSSISILTQDDTVRMSTYFFQVIAVKMPGQEDKLKITSFTELNGGRPLPAEAKEMFTGWGTDVILDYQVTASSGTLKGENVEIQLQRSDPPAPPSRDFNSEFPVRRESLTVTNCKVGKKRLQLQSNPGACPLKSMQIETQGDHIRLTTPYFKVDGRGTRKGMISTSFHVRKSLKVAGGKQAFDGWGEGASLVINVNATGGTITGGGLEVRLVEKNPPEFTMESMLVQWCFFNGSQTFGKDKCKFSSMSILTQGKTVNMSTYFFQVIATKVAGQEDKLRITSFTELNGGQPLPAEAKEMFTGWVTGVILDFQVTPARATLKGEHVEIQLQRFDPPAPPSRDFNSEFPVQREPLTVKSCKMDGRQLQLKDRPGDCPFVGMQIETQGDHIRLTTYYFDVDGRGTRKGMTSTSFHVRKSLLVGPKKEAFAGWSAGASLVINVDATGGTITGGGLEVRLGNDDLPDPPIESVLVVNHTELNKHRKNWQNTGWPN